MVDPQLAVVLSMLVVSISGARLESQAVQAFQELQSSFWDSKSSLWRSSMWWQTANTVETISTLAMQHPDLKTKVLPLLDSVFRTTSNDTRGRCNLGVNYTFSGYFDDEVQIKLAQPTSQTDLTLSPPTPATTPQTQY